VFLKGKQEKKYELVIIPNMDYGWYRDFYKGKMTVPISISGRIPHSYQNKIIPGNYPASLFNEIGGFTANITPKKIVKISIEAGIEKDCIVVQGGISEPKSGESILVCIEDKYGYKRSIYTRTNNYGKFILKYPLGKEKIKKDDLPQGHPSIFPVYGIYKVQAKTINAPTIASTKSNIVYVKYSG
jgi:hypothetical protein